ncbi:MAG: hypothetical protein GWO20_01625 [Candidatus Korarchaeota archaeon]|nr:hypothetical protein [Candidatus Korarchaeota archaeon]NIU82213.1 hypothetical protein [Candidatus Thorarchaeota archaeon]NIW12676.1 hypothetical protein [Candidatus Thorarchaeota archaeon]NIW50883.1 hypothetical protein [Candidatus Korarchaeota archaeon]
MKNFESLYEKIVTRMQLSLRKEDMLRTLIETLSIHQSVSHPHKVVQMLVGAFLLSKGYDIVKVEYPMKEILDLREVQELRVDVFGGKTSGETLKRVIFLEVETGHVPASHYSDQATYRRSRDSAKVARYFYPYSFKSGKAVDRVFGLVIPRFYIAQLPLLYVHSPKKRTEREIMLEKNVLDHYYNSPPISKDQIKLARLDYIFDVVPDLFLEGRSHDDSWIKKTNAKSYLKKNKARIMSVETLYQ